MGIDDVTSPTFTIIKEYIGELPLYHMDVYRLEDSNENIGIEEYFDKGGVTRRKIGYNFQNSWRKFKSNGINTTW